MLVDKKYDENDIVTFKLTNGDEIVAKVLSCQDNGWTIEKPCTVVPSNQGIMLIQSLFSANINKSVMLDSAHVIMHARTIQAMVDHYIETVTGIKTVNKGGLIV